jgi:type IV secretory pathway VirJ component
MNLCGFFNLLFLLTIPVLIENSLPASSVENEFPGFAISQTADQSDADLPLKVMEAKMASDMPLFVFITGDGGWNTFSRSVCENLAGRGIPVVALDSKKYFWDGKTPEQTTTDILSVVRTYTRLWRRDKFVIAGYSFGAAVVPFLINRFPPEVKKMVNFSILIAPDNNTDFEIHLSDMLNMGIVRGKYDVIKEIKAGDFKNYIAIFSTDENKKVEESYQLPGVKVETCEGNHHFDGAYDALANSIFAEIKRK